MASLGYKAVRTDRWKYIHYTEQNGMDELYDLAADPYELKNLMGDPRAQEARQTAKATLDKFQRAIGK